MDVKLYKRPDSPYYWMYWYVDGKINRKSTMTKAKNKAQKIAKKKERELEKQKGIIGYDKITLEDLKVEVINNYKLKARKYIDIMTMRLNHFVRFWGKEKKLIEINNQEISKYIDYRLKQENNRNENIKPSTINRELAALRFGFNVLIKKKIIGDKPNIISMREDNVRIGFFEHWEYEKILRNASAHIKPIIRFIYRTGWRMEEVLNLKWDYVDIDNGIINLPPQLSKNNEVRTFYLDKDLMAMFRKLWENHINNRLNSGIDIPYVFTNKKGTDRIKSFRTAWQKSCERAGLNTKMIHDFRRTAVRNLIRSGVSERLTMAITGHRTRSVFERYNIVSDTDLRQAIEKQHAYLNGLSGTSQDDNSHFCHPFTACGSGPFQPGLAEPLPQPVDCSEDAPVAQGATNQDSFAGKIEQHHPDKKGQQALTRQNQHSQAAQHK